MATTDCTLGCRFAKSKFLAKTYTFKPIELSCSKKLCSSRPGFTPLIDIHSIDAHFAELMETLRLHVYNTLRLPFAPQSRSRLVRNYWEVELLVKEMRLMLDPDLLSQLRLKHLSLKQQGEGYEPVVDKSP